MSRLDAALQRAATGVPVRQQPVQTPAIYAEPDESIAERDPDAGGDWQGHSRQTPDVVHDRPYDDGTGEEAKFRAFNSKHAEKLVVSSAMPEALREHYRRLGATLHHAQAESG